MPIDPNIPLQAKGVQLESPMNQLAMVGNAMKIGEMQRGIDTQNKLRELYSQGVDVSTPEGFRQLSAVDPASAIKLRTQALEGRKLEGDIKKTAVDIDQKTFDLAKQRMGDLAFNPSDSNIRAHIEDGLLRKEITPQQANATLENVMRMSPEQRKQYFTEMAVKVDERYKMNTISAAQQQSNITAIRGQDVSAATARRGQDITLQGQRMQYDPDLQAKISEAKAAGDFMGKNKATAAAALPSALEAANEGIRLIDEMVGKAEVRDKSGKVIEKAIPRHPGFTDYVGATLRPGMRFLEGSDAASFEVRQKQIEGKAFLEAFQTLKGGGAITEKEGEKGTAAIMRMNKASNEKEYVAAARELQGILRTGMDRARTKAGNVAPSAAPSDVVDYNSLK
jgi:hypothetical protein